MSALDLDRMLYVVICDHYSGPLIWERSLVDMDRATVVRHLREGQFDLHGTDGVLSVIEFNPVEHSCRDVTDDADIRAAMERDD